MPNRDVVVDSANTAGIDIGEGMARAMNDDEVMEVSNQNEKRNPPIRKRAKRDAAKQKRMAGKSYTGFRRAEKGKTNKVIQDVSRGGRTMKPPCVSEKCKKGKKSCADITNDDRPTMIDSLRNFGRK